MAYFTYMHLFYGKKCNGKLGDILIENTKSTIQVGEAKDKSGDYPFFTSGDAVLRWTEPIVEGRNTFLNTGGNADVKFYVGATAYSTDTCCITAKDDMEDYLYMLLSSIKQELNLKFFQGTGLKHLQKPLLKEKAIYIPSRAEISAFKDGLIPVSDAWKYMRMQLAGQTFKFNIRENLYYDNAERGFRPHDYLGLYTNKSVRAIGKICARIVTTNTENGLDFETEYGELTDERKQKIYLAIDDAISYGYDLRSVKQRYFFVEQFFETDFKKITPRPPMGTRIFDLAQVLNTETLPKTSEIAELLKTKDWS